MKITIEPTTDQTGRKYQHHGVTITHPEDELMASEVIELIQAALIAWGFNPETVKEYINLD